MSALFLAPFSFRSRSAWLSYVTFELMREIGVFNSENAGELRRVVQNQADASQRPGSSSISFWFADVRRHLIVALSSVWLYIVSLVSLVCCLVFALVRLPRILIFRAILAVLTST